MSIRFSAARGEKNPSVARVLCPIAQLDFANDNPRTTVPLGPRDSLSLRAVLRASHPRIPSSRGTASGAFFDALPDALRHFARHGLSSALQARIKAEAALAMGDELECARWLAVCRQFDRRMADAAERRFAALR